MDSIKRQKSHFQFQGKSEVIETSVRKSNCEIKTILILKKKPSQTASTMSSGANATCKTGSDIARYACKVYCSQNNQSC